MEEKKVCKPGFNSCDAPKECDAVSVEKVFENEDKECLPGFNTCEPPVKRVVKTDAQNVCKPGFNDCVKVEELVEEEIARNNDVFDVTEENFQEKVVGSDVPVLLEFWAEWCGHCKNMKPVVAEIAVLYEGQLKVGLVNVDEQPKIAEAFNVVGIPVLAVIKDGKIFKQEAGGKTKAQVNEFLADVVAAPEKVANPFKLEVAHEAPPADAPEFDLTCKPGYNDCGIQEPHYVEPATRNEEGVCLPGFNDCKPLSGVREVKPDNKDPEDKVCLPGFNDCK